MLLEKAIESTNRETSKFLKQAFLKIGNRDIGKMLVYSLRMKQDYDRTLVARLFFEAFSTKNRKWQDVLPVLSSVDVLDFSILIADDIFDKTVVRFKTPSPFITWGMDSAVIVSTIQANFSIELVLSMIRDACLTSSDIVRVLQSLTESYRLIYLGQFIDKQYEKKNLSEVRLKDYMEMIQLTTGEHLAGSAEIGAIAAGAPESKILLAGEIGRYLGMMLQIRDDFIDYVIDDNLTGKQPFRDFSSNKKRLPLILAYSHFPDITESLISKKKISDRVKNKIVKLVTDKAVVNDAKKMVGRLSQRALQKIKGIPETRARENIEDLLALIGGLEC